MARAPVYAACLVVAAAETSLKWCPFAPSPRAPYSALDADKVGPGRVATTNHKSGTYLATCLLSILSFRPKHDHRKTHTSGGYRDGANDTYLNMVRDPFVLIDSGFHYHRQNPEKWESWTAVPVEPNATASTFEGYAEAIRDYARLRDTSCGEARRFPALGRATYAQALQSLPLVPGLVLEALRALHADVPFVVASAVACDANARRRRGDPGAGTCTNVLLDEVMRDYAAAFATVADPLLRGSRVAKDAAWLKNRAAAFAAECDPRHSPPRGFRGDTKERQASMHTLSRAAYAERGSRLELLRQIDETYLNRALARANETIQALAHHITRPDS